jgi:hypothetical protein
VAALKAGDRNGWLATVDPKASDAFRVTQARIFDGLRSLPVEAYGLEARTDDSGDLGAGLDKKYGAPVQLPETRQRLRFKGYDDRDDIQSLWLTFVQRDGTWYVAGDDDLADLGLDTARGPWDFGAVQSIESDHFLTLFHPAQRERATALSAMAEEAIGTQAKRWDQPWSGRIPMIVPADTKELEQLLQSTIDLDKFVAFVNYSSIRDTGWEATAPRVYVQDANLSRYDRAFQVETLVHELTHAAGAPIAGPFIPAWVHEGVADWVATGRSTKERHPKGSDRVLPRDYEFSTGSQKAIVLAYAESRSATSYLAAKAGLGAPSALFRTLGDTKVAPGSVDYRVDAVVRAVAGPAFGLAELERGF